MITFRDIKLRNQLLLGLLLLFSEGDCRGGGGGLSDSY